MKSAFNDSMRFIEKCPDVRHLYRIKRGLVKGMLVDGLFIANDSLANLLFDEIRDYHYYGGSFLPALYQVANVSSLPGIINASIALPDAHSGYGFAIGNVAAFDMNDPHAIVSPGGVGFDINCGVRLIRTNLQWHDIQDKRKELCQKLYNHIPVGVGSNGILDINFSEIDQILLNGMDWSTSLGYSWAEDKEHVEEFGRMVQADASVVSSRAKKRGLTQLGTLGAGNHYAEIQLVEEIYDAIAAKTMGIDQINQVVVMIHSGSRGLGHQVATDSLIEMDSNMDCINDKQLAYAKLNSKVGIKYLKAMAAASNYAWVNRSIMTFLTRQAFAKTLQQDADDIDMHLVYDVSHNIAKIEEHVIDGKCKSLLVHRKGSTRAFGPLHPLIPLDYQYIGQPVLVGGTMGTCSYVLTGTNRAMELTFGSTCHGAGRAISRNKSRRKLDYMQVLQNLEEKDIMIRVASPNLISEEAPEAYKDVQEVVETCDEAGISKKCIKLKPVAVIKG